MPHVPYRTGITTIFRLMKSLCRIIVEFRNVIREVWTVEQLSTLDELVDLCEVILTYPNPRPYDE